MLLFERKFRADGARIDDKTVINKERYLIKTGEHAAIASKDADFH
jgi:hypothetical protein